MGLQGSLLKTKTKPRAVPTTWPFGAFSSYQGSGLQLCRAIPCGLDVVVQKSHGRGRPALVFEPACSQRPPGKEPLLSVFVLAL